MKRLVQLKHATHGRKVAVVDGNRLRLVRDADSVYRLAQIAFAENRSLEQIIDAHLAAESLDYGSVHEGRAEWRLMPAFDHPTEPSRCLVTGTGLTHKASAENRQAMHAADKPSFITDSMRMYQAGLEGGRPKPGEIGVAPEWFYKGTGGILRAHGEPLDVPPYGLDGGEEAEVAGAYIIDPSGAPWRVGLVLANEFSDHKMEEKSYLSLAPSKLRACSIGPELIVNGVFQDERGTVKITRNVETIWSRPFATGERNMTHTIANLEHHHFKFLAHRQPGDVHIHFFGADVFSFGDGIELTDGDIMEIELSGFGRALRNPIRIDRSPEAFTAVKPI